MLNEIIGDGYEIAKVSSSQSPIIITIDDVVLAFKIYSINCTHSLEYEDTISEGIFFFFEKRLA